MIPQIHKGSVAWMNYALCVSTGVVIPLVVLTKEKYIRSDLDTPSPVNSQKNTQSQEDGGCDSGKIYSGGTVPYHVMQ